MLYSLTRRSGVFLVRRSPSTSFALLTFLVPELDNILSRLVPPSSSLSKAKTTQRSPPLTQLLQHERLHGTTSERDPREKRHDFQYFSKGSYFLLVEDILGELAPIAIMEYPGQVRSAEKDKPPTYPVLYMDPRARSPFVRYDKKEAQKLEKLEANEKLKEIEREKHRSKVKELLKRQHEEMRRREKTLRRCASMGDLGRRAVTHTDFKDLGSETSGNGAGLCDVKPAGDKDDSHQQIASGFAPSTTGPATGHGYLAASGNSVAITSTATTSFAQRGINARLPPNLRERLGRQVITSRRLEGAGGKENTNPFEARLRKAKSTTTMRLPAREESKKPGYCEACRIKFEDFTEVCVVLP
jgi:regulatory subunit for Cdc7p protein kinase